MFAQVAKLVDALPSGGSVRKDVLVRIQSWAPKIKSPNSLTVGAFFIKKQAEIAHFSLKTLLLTIDSK